MIKGSSTNAWPKVMLSPAFLSLYPWATVAAKTGPGMSTPESEMKTTLNKKRPGESSNICGWIGHSYLLTLVGTFDRY